MPLRFAQPLCAHNIPQVPLPHAVVGLIDAFDHRAADNHAHRQLRPRVDHPHSRRAGTRSSMPAALTAGPSRRPGRPTTRAASPLPRRDETARRSSSSRQVGSANLDRVGHRLNPALSSTQQEFTPARRGLADGEGEHISSIDRPSSAPVERESSPAIRRRARVVPTKRWIESATRIMMTSPLGHRGGRVHQYTRPTVARAT